MPLVISDDTLAQANLSEQEARLELACRLFDLDRLPLGPAAQLAGLTRVAFEEALVTRGIAPYRPTVEEVQHDLKALRDLDRVCS